MGNYFGIVGRRVGVRSVCSTVDSHGEEEVSGKFEHSYDVITSESHLSLSLLVPNRVLRVSYSQTPGSFVFVYTLAIRPGVDFTGWAPYFVTGILQGTLLILCLIFKRRQTQLGVDDWGNELTKGASEAGRRDGERARLLG